LDFSFLFIHDNAPPHISTLSLHDALPICPTGVPHSAIRQGAFVRDPEDRAESLSRGVGVLLAPEATGATPKTDSGPPAPKRLSADRKSTRLNSSHGSISYAVFCLKNKNLK